MFTRLLWPILTLGTLLLVSALYLKTVISKFAVISGKESEMWVVDFEK